MTLRPLLAAVLDALDALVVVGVSGGLTRTSCCIDPETGLEDEEDSTVGSPSVVSFPLSSWTEKSSPSD